MQEQELRYLLGHFQRVELDASVRDASIHLRRQHRLKLPDAVIAASALVHDAILLTNDQRLLTIPNVRARSVEIRQ
ncbi:hypothetical protein CCP3SC15_100020 [Gammaproteobacteria bacterium]